MTIYFGLILIALPLILALYFYHAAIADMTGLLPFWIKMWRIDMHVDFEKYRYGKHRRQYFLICRAEEKAKKRKQIILYFHGGGWQFGSPDAFLPAAQVLTDAGYPVVMASHRRLPLYGYTAMREDLSLLLDKTWEVMQQHNLQDRDIIVGGMSSGGNLAALLYFDVARLNPLPIPNEKLVAVFLQAAPLDLTKMIPSPTMYLYAGSRSGQTYRDASPITYLDAPDDRPIYLVHGDKDGIVCYDCTISFKNRLEEAGFTNVRFETVKNGKHTAASDWAAEENEVRRKLLEWLEKVG